MIKAFTQELEEKQELKGKEILFSSHLKMQEIICAKTYPEHEKPMKWKPKWCWL